jgi:transposase, IS30 family
MPGPVPLMAQRQEFAQLNAKGVSNSEACRLVGVNRRTGTRWLFGRTVTFKSGAELQYPPMATTRRHSSAELRPSGTSGEVEVGGHDLRRVGRSTFGVSANGQT